MIDKFEGEYFFLSNFYPSQVTFMGITYLNSEAAYQAQKCSHSIDKEQFKNLLPNEAKKLGRKIRLRSDWEDIKYSVMMGVVYSKFTQNPILAKKLINTGDEELIEGNWWNDTYWGICNGKGCNHLGIILMNLREVLRGQF